MEISDELKQTVGRALGRVPSGAFVLTAGTSRPQYTAMLVSWVQQAAFEPPTISLALANERPALELIEKTGCFALCVLAADDHGMLRRYGRGVPAGEDPFDGVKIDTLESGVPILVEALAWLECRVTTICRFDADHSLIVAQATAGSVLKDGTPFLHVRGHGFHY